MMGGTLSHPGCDKPKKPGLDRVKCVDNHSMRLNEAMQVSITMGIMTFRSQQGRVKTNIHCFGVDTDSAIVYGQAM